MLSDITSRHTTIPDSRDSLAHFRERFHIPRAKDGNDIAYFCGNSLGLQPIAAREAIEIELASWAELAVDGHFSGAHPWMTYHEELAEPLARIVGARPDEVVAMNTLSVNLHLLMVSFYRPQGKKRKIVIEEKAFPSDQYAVASQLRFHGADPARDLVEIPLGADGLFDTDTATELLHSLRDEAALLLLGGVNYYNGQYFDIPRLTQAAHAAGMQVGVDLAHAAGNVPLRLHDWDVDFAAWCSYKYMNAGPGSTAGAFVHKRHASNADLPRFAGWWGHDKSTRFAMPHDFVASPGADGWQLSNPSILPMAALRASLQLFDQAGMEALREKSVRLTAYLEHLLLAQASEEWRIITPSSPEARGCQLSVRFREHGRGMFQWLHAHGIVCDWREPDVIRMAPVPLYNTFADVERLAECFHAYPGDGHHGRRHDALSPAGDQIS
ncbi:MAG: kynureninase [Bacteroidia bacterium]|nr:kynureninase [Bacteroidia bacterium]